MYAYAYGQLLALSVYERYEQAGAELVPRYLELLAAGGSRSPEELGEIVGVDLADPGFWDGGPRPRRAPARGSRSGGRGLGAALTSAMGSIPRSASRRPVPVAMLLALVLATLSMAAASPAMSSAATSGAPGLRLRLDGLSEGQALSQPWAGRPRTRALQTGISLTPSKMRPHWACPEGPCEAIVDPPAVQGVRIAGALPAGGPLLEGSGEKGGFDPQDLQSAYKIPTLGRFEDQTIALVDADGYPEAAESDLAKYRERYGLSSLAPPRTPASKRSTKTGEEENYPAPSQEWETETALDLDMASAACAVLSYPAGGGQRRRPILSRARSVDTAARPRSDRDLQQLRDSPKSLVAADGCEEYNADYDHPGVSHHGGRR